MKKHTRRPRTEYEALYKRKVTERLTYEALSADSGVPIATLQYWFRRFNAEQHVPQEASDHEGQGAFARVDIVEAGDNAVEVILRGDIRLRVKAGFDEQTVRRLLQVFEC